jgi:phage FluMu protein Com
MHQDVTCKLCEKVFRVESPSGPAVAKSTYPAQCPYCGAVNAVRWPATDLPRQEE